MEKKTILLVVGIIICFIIAGFYYIANENNNKISYAKTNYEGLIKLGLAPNSEPRWAQENDIDTGLRGKSGGYTFGLFESRTWEEGDYGKTFISPINE